MDNTYLTTFVRQLLGVVGLALAAVALTAFISMPLTFGGHPGEQGMARAVPNQAVSQHTGCAADNDMAMSAA